MEASGKNPRRLKFGLRLVLFSPGLTAVALVAAGFMGMGTDTFYLIALAAIAAFATGKAFCLFAPAGRLWLAACLGVELLAVGLGRLDHVFFILLLVAAALFLAFLHQFGKALPHPPLRARSGQAGALFLASVLVAGVALSLTGNPDISVPCWTLFAILAVFAVFLYLHSLNEAMTACLAWEKHQAPLENVPVSAA